MPRAARGRWAPAPPSSRACTSCATSTMRSTLRAALDRRPAAGDRGRGLHRLRGRGDRPRRGHRGRADRRGARRRWPDSATSSAHGAPSCIAPRRRDLISAPAWRRCAADGRVEAVELADGTLDRPTAAGRHRARRLPNDRVAGGQRAALVRRWLQCDETLTAVGDPDVLGAGDVVSWPQPLPEASRRVEHWTVAAEQGQLAGRNALAARPSASPTRSPPYFWSDQYGVKIQAVGFPARAHSLRRSSRPRPETANGSSRSASATVGWSG